MLELLMDLSVLRSHNITSSALQEKMTSTKEVKTKAVSIVEYLSVNLKVFFLTTYSLLYLPCTYAGFFPLCCSYFKEGPWTNLRSVGGFSEM